MEYEVDHILDGWFGEPPEYSDDEKLRLRALYEPLRKLERRMRDLEKQLAEQSWHSSPDRSGGQFSPDEMRRETG